MLNSGLFARLEVDWPEGCLEDKTIGFGEKLRGYHLFQIAKICHQLI